MVGFADEVWFSRLAQPHLHTWTTAHAVRLNEKLVDKADPDPKAIACYGLLRVDTGHVSLRFVNGRPVSHVTTQFLHWVTDVLAQEGKRALLLIWDNASWHISREVRTWIAVHNERAKQQNGVRLLICQLPSKSPWLNRIEPQWKHGKRAVVEPDRKLTASELQQRLCDYYQCERLEPIAQQAA